MRRHGQFFFFLARTILISEEITPFSQFPLVIFEPCSRYKLDQIQVFDAIFRSDVKQVFLTYMLSRNVRLESNPFGNNWILFAANDLWKVLHE